MSAESFLPARKTMSNLKKAVDLCRGCELYKNATQGVMGEGPRTARIVFIGEQPGDAEDKAGKPFVGPAGRLLDVALVDAGINRDDVFVTNAVKHFKWEPRGTRRLHKKPSSRELQACRPWLDAELELIEPEGIVCLGATAAQGMLGRDFRITAQHGKLMPFDQSKWIVATWHPSAVLRAPDADRRHQMQRELVADLKVASDALR